MEKELALGRIWSQSYDFNVTATTLVRFSKKKKIFLFPESAWLLVVL
jgi:hypothetical protein